ncbi:lipoprotein [uncultured Marinobacter sp.]|uniref:LPS translocon maturation chaperone LptM n=1 Tax=uncultured Marinobacter sp. TaxID=187379 RepID=UPI0030D73530|tara:strand:+ start:704 stop:856 length:153 start_codon:yes stop_codon:yes gene_type:complete
MTTQKTVILVLTLAFAVLVLSGCGQKGPLERPGAAAKASATAALASRAAD